MSFDEIIDRRGSHCVKWDMMEAYYGVSPEEGLSMWVADMEFRPPACVQDTLRDMVDHGVFGYFGMTAPTSRRSAGGRRNAPHAPPRPPAGLAGAGRMDLQPPTGW